MAVPPCQANVYRGLLRFGGRTAERLRYAPGGQFGPMFMRLGTAVRPLKKEVKFTAKYAKYAKRRGKRALARFEADFQADHIYPTLVRHLEALVTAEP